MATKLLYVENFCKKLFQDEMTFLTNEGNSSSTYPIINSSSKLWLAEERGPLTQHFFLVPGVEFERWMYPQPWTQGSFHKPQGWWNVVRRNKCFQCCDFCHFPSQLEESVNDRGLHYCKEQTHVYWSDECLKATKHIPEQNHQCTQKCSNVVYPILFWILPGQLP